jgi:hypothetical protein
MTTYYLNGTPIVEGSDITLNGYTYPYSWLEGTTPSVRASLGIEATGDVNYDPKYYWNNDTTKPLNDVEELDEDENPAYVKVWDPLAVVEGSDQVGAMVDTTERIVTKGLKTTCASDVRGKTNELLSATDYYIIRSEVEQLEIPADVATYRAAVIAESDRVTIAIAAVTTVEELIEVMSSIAWPESN